MHLVKLGVTLELCLRVNPKRKCWRVCKTYEQPIDKIKKNKGKGRKMTTKSMQKMSSAICLSYLHISTLWKLQDIIREKNTIHFNFAVQF